MIVNIPLALMALAIFLWFCGPIGLLWWLITLLFTNVLTKG